MKNNQNTHHSNSLPIKTILIPTSAFIFSMSEYFFLLIFPSVPISNQFIVFWDFMYVATYKCTNFPDEKIYGHAEQH